VSTLRRATHQTLKRVTDDFEGFQFNTLVAALMEYTNTLYKLRAAAEGTPAWDEALDTLVKMLAPLAPHPHHRAAASAVPARVESVADFLGGDKGVGDARSFDRTAGSVSVGMQGNT